MVRGKRFLLIVAVIVWVVGGTLLIWPGLSEAEYSKPQLHTCLATPSRVHVGAQPESSPVFLSVRSGGPGGSIATVFVNLDTLVGAQYYDPDSDTFINGAPDTPMHRVYEIDEQEGYLVKLGSRHEYNEYRITGTHELVRGEAVATDKWQVELPYAGNLPGEYCVRVIADNTIFQEGYAQIEMELVDDTCPPRVLAFTEYPIDSPVTAPGDTVTIQAFVADNESGVYGLRLLSDSAYAVFGENARVKLGRLLNSNLWLVENVIPRNIGPGRYDVELAAVDRAGNETRSIVSIQVADRIHSFQMELVRGSNLISIPKAASVAAVEELFEGFPIISVKTMIGGQWRDATEILPGYGYLVDAGADCTVEVTFAEHALWMIPPMIELDEGWNLIGYASATLEPVIPITFYLGEELKDRWLMLRTMTGDQARAKATSPYIWATSGFSTTTGEPSLDDPSDNLPVLELGKGYWIYMVEAGTVIP